MINNFVAIDFETACGKNPCSIGIVEFENGKVINEYYSLIKPKELKFNPFAQRIHKIGINDVINEREFDEVWEDIKHFFDKRNVVAHNYSFDISVLNYCLESYLIEKPIYEIYCTLKLSRLYLDIKNHKLSTIANFFDINQNNYHNALEDALVCGKVFINLMNYSKSSNDLKPKRSKSNSSNHTKEGINRSSIFETNGLKVKSSIFENKYLVISGVFSKMSRNELKKSIEDNGGKVSSSISKKTTYIVAGDNMGPSKLKKATDIEIPIISEDDYLAMLA